MAKRRTSKAPAALSAEEPPSTPTYREQVQRAIVLLGNRSNGLDLGAKARAELVALVGGYPTPPTAARWKLALKQVVDDPIFDRTA
jgi:hypothetical protein